MSNLFEYSAVVKWDASEFKKGMKESEGSFQSFKTTMGSIANGIAVTLGATIAAGAAGMYAFGKSAVDAGMQFDAAMSQVAATMGLTVDEITELREFALKMGAETAFSATQAAEALNYMALAGYDAKTSMAMLPTVLNLAAAGGMDLARASDMITDTQSALGLSIEETTELVDKMAQASSKSNTSVSQLGDAMLTVGGTAKNLKGGTTELATALGILADNGIKGAEGGTALRNIILSLTAPTDAACDAMARFGGMEKLVYDEAGNMRDLNSIFSDLNDIMGEMSQQERINLMSTIFNKRDLKSAEALIANVGSRWNELTGYIDNAQGAAQKMAETQLDNLTGDITLMKSALEGVKIQFSDGITPALREIVQTITKTLSKGETQKFIKELGETLGELLKTLLSICSEYVLPLFIKLLENGAEKFKTLVVVIGSVVAIMKVLDIAMSTSPIGLMAMAIGGLIGACILLSDTVEDVDYTIQGLSESEKEAVEKARDLASAYDDAVDSYNKSVAKIDAEMGGVKTAWTELKTLVDENGTVMEGYEGRVDTLLAIINESLGTQYERNGDIITQYGEMADSLDLIIQKKQAELLLDANKELYTQAIENKQLALDRLGIAGEQLETRKAEYEQAKAELELYEQSHAEQIAQVLAGTLDLCGHIPAGLTQVSTEYYNLRAAMGTATEALEQQEAEYAEASASADTYYAEVQRYQDAYQAVLEEDFARANQLLTDNTAYKWQNYQEGQTITEQELADLQAAYDDKVRQVELYKQKYEAGIYGYTKSELEEMEAARDSIKKILDEQVAAASASGKEVGKQFGAGVDSGANGMSASVKNTAQRLARSMVNAMKATLEIASPSKVMKRIGKWTVQGLTGGLDENGKDAVKSAKRIAGNIVDTFDDMSDGINSDISGGVKISAMFDKSSLPQTIKTNLDANIGGIGSVFNRFIDRAGMLVDRLIDNFSYGRSGAALAYGGFNIRMGDINVSGVLDKDAAVQVRQIADEQVQDLSNQMAHYINAL